MDEEDNENEEFIVGDSQEDTAWLIDLEAALLSDCDFGTLRSLCHSHVIPRHLRAAVWRICLNIEKREAVVFHDVFDLPEQSNIHDDCVVNAEKIQFDCESDKITALSNMESVITEFCKRTGQKYSPLRKWLDILRHLSALNLSRQDLYHFFVAITERYSVWNIGLINAASTLFRLLMLYHDPELCSFFDTKKIEISAILRPWLLSIFADGISSSDVLLSFWDCYFLQADTFFVFFLAYVVILNLKEQLTAEWKQLDRGEIVKNIQSGLSQLSVEDIADFFNLSLHYASQTPASFRNDYSFLFFDSTTHQRDEQCTSELAVDTTTISPSPSDLSKLDTALCLQLSVPELMQSLQLSGALRFFIVDCRPAEQYNVGHLRGSVHLDASLLLDDPAAYNTAVAAVIDLQQSRLSRHGEEADPPTGLGPGHICFVGSGRDEEDKLVNMVIANFLQRQMRRVAVLRGGYAAVHEGSWANLDEAIADHDEKSCIVCLEKPASSNSPKKPAQSQSSAQASSGANRKDGTGKEWTQNTMNFMRGFGSSLKSRFGEVMSKGLAVAANTANAKATGEQKSSSGGLSLPSRVAHVIGTGSKAYRRQQQADVFALNEDGDSDREETETVNIAGFIGRPDVKHSFACKLLDKDDNLTPSHLVITSTHVFILRQLEDVPEMACVHSRKRLDAIMKITSRRQMPELITLRYGRLLPEPVDAGENKAGDQEQRMEIEGGDRLFIPERAGEAASAVKYQIVQYLRSTNPGSEL